MLTAEKPARTDLKKEIAARVSIMHWAEALRRRNDAQAKLEVVADAPSEDTTDAVGLIEEYQAATKELLAARGESLHTTSESPPETTPFPPATRESPPVNESLPATRELLLATGQTATREQSVDDRGVQPL